MKNIVAFAKNGYFNSYTGLSRKSWVGFTLNCLQAIALGICFFLSIYFVNALHLEIIKAGFLISLFGVGTVTGGFLGGHLADRFSTTSIAIISLLIESLAFFYLSSAKTFFGLGITLIILGLSAYSFKTVNDVWTLNQSENDANLRLKSVNILRAASNLGLGISGFLIGFVTANHFKYFFIFSAIVLFFSASIFHIISSNEKNWCASNSVEKTNLTSKPCKKIIAFILLSIFFIGLLIAQLSSTYPIFIQASFPVLGTKAVSILFLLDTLIIVLFQAPLLHSLKNFPKVLLVGIGAFLMGLGFLMLAFSFSFLLAILSCLIWTTGEMIFMSLAQLVCYENSSVGNKGKTMGLFQMIFASSTIIGPSFGSYIYQHYSPNLLWFLSGFIGVLFLLLFTYANTTSYKRCI